MIPALLPDPERQEPQRIYVGLQGEFPECPRVSHSRRGAPQMIGREVKEMGHATVTLFVAVAMSAPPPGAAGRQSRQATQSQASSPRPGQQTPPAGTFRAPDGRRCSPCYCNGTGAIGPGHSLWGPGRNGSVGPCSRRLQTLRMGDGRAWGLLGEGPVAAPVAVLIVCSPCLPMIQVKKQAWRGHGPTAIGMGAGPGTQPSDSGVDAGTYRTPGHEVVAVFLGNVEGLSTRLPRRCQHAPPLAFPPITRHWLRAREAISPARHRGHWGSIPCAGPCWVLGPGHAAVRKVDVFLHRGATVSEGDDIARGIT